MPNLTGFKNWARSCLVVNNVIEPLGSFIFIEDPLQVLSPFGIIYYKIVCMSVIIERILKFVLTKGVRNGDHVKVLM